MYEPERPAGQPSAPKSARAHWRVLAVGFFVTIAFTQGVVYGQNHPTPVSGKPSPSPSPTVHGTVYLLGCEGGKRVELSKYAGEPEVQVSTTLGKVSRWHDGSGQTLMTRAAVLFVEDKR